MREAQSKTKTHAGDGKGGWGDVQPRPTKPLSISPEVSIIISHDNFYWNADNISVNQYDSIAPILYQYDTIMIVLKLNICKIAKAKTGLFIIFQDWMLVIDN